MRIGLDATYSVGEQLTGIGVYSREIIQGLAGTAGSGRITLAYRPHRYWRALSRDVPRGCRRRLLFERIALASIDVFHGLNQRLPAARYRRTVSTFHDLFVMSGDYSTDAFRERFTRQAVEAAQRSDLIIAVSEFTAGQVREQLGVEDSRVRVVPHGVRLPPRLPDTREKIVLHVGAVQKRKNISRLVKAFAAMPDDWKLVLAGSDGYGAERIRAEVEAIACRARIEFTGYVDDAALDQLYSSAGIFAFPSLDEGFGIPVLEAMAWGVPVVTSNRSALPEVGGDAVLYADPEREEEIAGALCRLAGDEGLRKDLAARGRIRAAEFSWGESVRRTFRIYRELTG